MDCNIQTTKLSLTSDIHLTSDITVYTPEDLLMN